MKEKEIKIEKGVTDVQNILKHLESEEKQARKEQWLKDNYGKHSKGKDSHD